jgi:hypothetical protein
MMRIGVGWAAVAGRIAGSVLAIDQEELTGNFSRKGYRRLVSLMNEGALGTMASRLRIEM